MVNLKSAYAGKRVLVTGNTGFKGSWLSMWLEELGAEVYGYALKPTGLQNNFNICALSSNSTFADIRDIGNLEKAVVSTNPEIIFHLAAQPLVLESYSSPRETMDVNALGTVNVLEVTRKTKIPKTVVCITTDKCYENAEQTQGYRETDRLGGADPYSASKAMAELAIEAYRKSFFSAESHNVHGTVVSSARAGNVIGGGDFAENRILPDAMKAFMSNSPVTIRNPSSVRPWQHVLEPLAGYLILGAKMQENPNYGEAWNFGPDENEVIDVRRVVERAYSSWNNFFSINSLEGGYVISPEKNPKKETGRLIINSDKSRQRLNWSPVWNWETAVDKTVDWFRQYKQFMNTSEVEWHDMRSVCVEQINSYVSDARAKGIEL